MNILFAGHAGYGGAVLRELLDDASFNVVGVIHASHVKSYNLKRMIRRRFGTWRRLKLNIRKILSNVPKLGQATYVHSHGFELVDPYVVAKERGIPLYDVSIMQSADFLEQITSKSVDVFLVATFGELIPMTIIQTARVAAINIHPGMLPLHRGGFPELSAMLAGDHIAGITYHTMTERFDDGDILARYAVEIGESDTLQIKQKLIALTASTVVPVLKSVESLMATRMQQKSSESTKCRYPAGYNVVSYNSTLHSIKRKVRAAAGENYEVILEIDGTRIALLELSDFEGKGLPVKVADGTLWMKAIRRGRKIFEYQ